MRALRFIVPICASSLFWAAPAHAEHYIIGLRGGSISPQSVQFTGINKTDNLQDSQAVVVDIPEGSRAAMLKKIQSDKRVEYIEKDRIIEAAAVPAVDDPRLSDQWSLNSISLFDAWSIGWPQVDDSAPVVAVLDSGVDMSHEDLVGAAWTNPGEIPGNGIDDDNNGYVDDINGWNWSENNADTSDPVGHGTHVAGIIAARANNGIGIVGIAPRTKIMPLRVLAANGNTLNGAVSDAVQAIDYAVVNGAKIINNSWGYYMSSDPALNAAINRARAAGVLVVNAAGNGDAGGNGVNIDPAADPRNNPTPNPYYPASYGQDNTLAVAATGSNGQLTDWSNYGAKSVNLAAPGNQILSTTPGDHYQLADGTSMAAPMVAGAAAWMWGMRPTATYKTVRRALAEFGGSQKSLSGKTVGSHNLNLLSSWKWFRGAAVFPRNIVPPAVDTVAADRLQCFSNSWDAGGGLRWGYSWWEQKGDPGSPTYSQLTPSTSNPYLSMGLKYWGKKLRCKVKLTNSAGSSQPLISSNYKILQMPYPVNSALPSVSGAAGVDRSLQCSPGRWAYMDGSNNYAYAWKLDGVLTDDTTNSYTIQVSDAGKTLSCVVTATNNALGEGSDSQSTAAQGRAFKVSWVADSVSPFVPTLTGIPQYTNQQSQAFRLSGERLALFRCSLDNASPVVCPARFDSLSAGEHSLSVTQMDLAGNISTAATKSWTVDLTPPQPPVVSGSALNQVGDGSSGLTNSSTVNLQFNTEESNAKFQCKFASEKYFSSCSSTRQFTRLKAGSYSLQVRQQDQAGNWSTPVTYSWTVDLSIPIPPSINTRPSAHSVDHSGDITFAGEVGASFRCVLDGQASSCTSPFHFSDLEDGDHTFSVTQSDQAGNTSSANSFSWSISAPDTTPPVIPVISGVPTTGYTNQNKISISWTGEAGGAYQCSVDANPDNYKPCSSPVSFTYTQAGAHDLKVRQIDDFGNIGEPATAHWVIDFSSPVVDSWILPTTPTNADSISYTVNFSEPVNDLTAADFVLSGTAKGCVASTNAPSDGTYFSNATVSVSGCSAGTAILSLNAVTIKDRAGNIGPSAKSGASTTTIDRTAPGVISWTSPSTPNRATSLSFTLRFTKAIVGLEGSDISNTGTAEGCILSPSASSGVQVTVVASGCGEGTVTPTLAANGVVDQAGNTGPAAISSAASIVVDRTKPAASWSSVPATPTNSSSLSYTLSFSEPISGLTATDLSNTGTATGCTLAVSSTTTPGVYQVTVTSCSGGTVVLRLATSSIADQAGNTGPDGAVDAGAVLVDRAKPVATWSAAPSTPTNTSDLQYTLSFDKSVTGLTNSDFTISGSATGCSIDPQPISGTNSYTVAVVGCSAGTVILSLVKDSVIDSAGNTGPATKKDSQTVNIDRTTPTVSSMLTAANSPTNASILTYTLVFAEPVTGVSVADFNIGGDTSGWSIDSVSGGGSTYTVSLKSNSPTDGSVYPILASGGVTDLAGNIGPAADYNGESVSIDQTAATVVSFISATSSPSNKTSLSYILHFSEAVSGLAKSDFTIGGTATGWSVASVSGNGSTYTVILGPSAPTDGTVLPILGKNKVQDASGNLGPADSASGNAISIDRTAPAVTSFTTDEASPSTSSTLTYTLTLSESVSGLGSEDFQVLGTATGWSVSDVSGSDSTYTVILSSDSPTDGTVYPRLQKLSLTDSAGNYGPSTLVNGSVVTVDQTAPSVISFDTATTSPSNTDSLSYTLVLSEPVSGFTADNLQVGGDASGWEVSSVSGSGATYTVTLRQGADGTDGSVYPILSALSLTDQAGNVGPESDENGQEITIDQTAPSVAAWNHVPDSITNETSLTYEVLFSEPISGFTASDIQNTGTATGCVFTPEASSGTSISFTASDCSEGTVDVSVTADGVIDQAGNTGPFFEDDADSITIDRTPPTATWTVVPSSPAGNADLTYTLSFSEDVSGIDASSFSNAGSATDCVFTPSDASGTSVDVVVSGCSEGTVILSLSVDGVTDQAGNTGPAINTDADSVLIDLEAPSATWSSIPVSPTNNAVLSYTIVFSELVSGIDSSSFSNSGSATDCVFEPSSDTGTSITVSVSDCSEGTVILSLAADGVTDQAGNTGPVSSMDANAVSIDRASPTVSWTSPGSPTNSSSLSYTLNFSEPVSGVSSSDFTNRGTATGCTFTPSASIGTSITITVAHCSEGTVVARLAAGGVTDQAGNTGPVSSMDADAVSIDRTSPTASWTTPGSPTNSLSLSYTLNFSEPVSGITSGDFTNRGTATGCVFAPSASAGASITITVTSCSAGTVALRLAASGVTDQAGNTGPSTSTDSSGIIIDRTAPTASWTSVPSSPNTSLSLAYTLTFSKSVSGIASGDFTNTGTATGCVFTPASASGISVVVTVSGCSDGTVVMRLAAGGITDTAGNTGPVANTDSSSVTVDRSAPTAAWSSVPSTPTKNSSLTYTLTFSESVSGISSSDFTNTGTATGCVFTPSASSGTSVTVTVASCSEGTVTLSINGAAVYDAVGNTGPASADTQRTASEVTIDRHADQLTLLNAPSTWSNSSTASISWVGEQDATYECSTDSGATYSSCLSPYSATGLSEGAHSVQVRQSDLAGNVSTPTSASWTVDTIAPSAPTFSTKPSSYIIPASSTSLAWSGETYATYQCSTNGGTSWSSCSTPKTIDSSAAGSYQLLIKQYDRAGNASSSAQADWTSKDIPKIAWDTTNANNSLYGYTGTAQTNGGTANFPYEQNPGWIGISWKNSGGSATTYQCADDGVTWTTCSWVSQDSDAFGITNQAGAGCGAWNLNYKVRAQNETTLADTTTYPSGYTTPITINVHRKCPSPIVYTKAPRDSYETTGTYFNYTIEDYETTTPDASVSCVWNILSAAQTASCNNSTGLDQTGLAASPTTAYQTGYASIQGCSGCWSTTNSLATYSVSATSADGLSSTIQTASRKRRTNGYALAQAVNVDGTATTGWTSRTCLSGASSQVADISSTGAAFSVQPSGTPTEFRVTNSTCSGVSYYGIATAAPIYNYGDDIQFTARLTGTTGTPQIQPRIRTVVGGGTADTTMANTVLSSTTNKTCRIYLGSSTVGGSIYMQISGRGSTTLGAYGGYYDNFSSTGSVGSSANGGSCA